MSIFDILRPFGRPTAVAIPLKQEAVVDPILQYFAVPPNADARTIAVSRPFFELASNIAGLTATAERTNALRKLLEARDAAIRAATAGL